MTHELLLSAKHDLLMNYLNRAKQFQCPDCGLVFSRHKITNCPVCASKKVKKVN
jgi:rubrerythrin